VLLQTLHHQHLERRLDLGSEPLRHWVGCLGQMGEHQLDRHVANEPKSKTVMCAAQPLWPPL
ncbi:MAG: hypothetical protein ACI9MR_004717, partial [Myxococcota bacterium]